MQPRKRSGSSSSAAGARRGGKRFYYRRRKVCKFCAEKIDYIDWKDERLLSAFIPERAKILPTPHLGYLCPSPAKAEDGNPACP